MKSKKDISLEKQLKIFKYAIILVVIFLLITNWQWILTFIGNILIGVSTPY